MRGIQVTTPPSGPYDGQNRPHDVPHFPPGQPNQYGQPAQPGQYDVRVGNYGGQFQPQSYNPYGQGGSGQGGYGYGYAPPGQLAGWPIRVGASVLDSLITSFPWIVGIIASVAISGDSDDLTPAGGIAMAAGFFVAFLVWVWNRVIQQGRTGQSLGKKATGLKVVHQQTGQLIGMGANLGREVLALIFNELCFLNLLWPLWDEKQQTWHDKVVNDIVIRT
jgi:uncharacterized RDD family membrane protein YckC